MGHEDKRGEEGEREGLAVWRELGERAKLGDMFIDMTCFIRTLIESIFRCLLTFMFTLVRQLVSLSIGGSVEWLVVGLLCFY